MASPRKRLGELLVEAGAIDAMQLQAALGYQRQWGGKLGTVLVERRFLSEAKLVATLSKQLAVPVVRIADRQIDARALAALPAHLASQLHVFPLEIKGPEKAETLVVAMSDPTDLAAVDQVQFATRKRVQAVLAGDRDVSSAIRRHYHHEDVSAPAEEATDGELAIAGADRDSKILGGDEDIVPGIIRWDPDSGSPAGEPSAGMIGERPSPVAAAAGDGLGPPGNLAAGANGFSVARAGLALPFEVEAAPEGGSWLAPIASEIGEADPLYGHHAQPDDADELEELELEPLDSDLEGNEPGAGLALESVDRMADGALIATAHEGVGASGEDWVTPSESRLDPLGQAPGARPDQAPNASGGLAAIGVEGDDADWAGFQSGEFDRTGANWEGEATEELPGEEDVGGGDVPAAAQSGWLEPGRHEAVGHASDAVVPGWLEPIASTVGMEPPAAEISGDGEPGSEWAGGDTDAATAWASEEPGLTARWPSEPPELEVGGSAWGAPPEPVELATVAEDLAPGTAEGAAGDPERTTRLLAERGGEAETAPSPDGGWDSTAEAPVDQEDAGSHSMDAGGEATGRAAAWAEDGESNEPDAELNAAASWAALDAPDPGVPSADAATDASASWALAPSDESEAEGAAGFESPIVVAPLESGETYPAARRGWEILGLAQPTNQDAVNVVGVLIDLLVSRGMLTGAELTDALSAAHQPVRD